MGRDVRHDPCAGGDIEVTAVHIVAVVHSGFRKAVSQYFIQLGSEAFLTLAESFFLAYI